MGDRIWDDMQVLNMCSITCFAYFVIDLLHEYTRLRFITAQKHTFSHPK